MLREAGVNTTNFGAHSMRNTAASSAVVEGAPIDVILRAAS
jgi:hypothetical protein